MAVGSGRRLAAAGRVERLQQAEVLHPPPVQPPRQPGRGDQPQQRADGRRFAAAWAAPGRRGRSPSPAPSRPCWLPARPRRGPPRLWSARSSSCRLLGLAVGLQPRVPGLAAELLGRGGDLVARAAPGARSRAATSCLAAAVGLLGHRLPVGADHRVGQVAGLRPGGVQDPDGDHVGVPGRLDRQPLLQLLAGQPVAVEGDGPVEDLRRGDELGLAADDAARVVGLVAAGVQVQPDDALVADRLRRRPHEGRHRRRPARRRRQATGSVGWTRRDPALPASRSVGRPTLPLDLRLAPCPAIVSAHPALCAVHAPYVRRGRVGATRHDNRCEDRWTHPWRTSARCWSCSATIRPSTASGPGAARCRRTRGWPSWPAAWPPSTSSPPSAAAASPPSSGTRRGSRTRSTWSPARPAARRTGRPPAR